MQLRCCYPAFLSDVFPLRFYRSSLCTLQYDVHAPQIQLESAPVSCTLHPVISCNPQGNDSQALHQTGYALPALPEILQGPPQACLYACAVYAQVQ